MQTFPDKKSISRSIDRLLNSRNVRGPLHYLRTSLPAASEIYIVGGAIRDVIIEASHGTRPRTEDIDVFIGNLKAGFDPADIFAEDRFKFTDLGGVRWRPEDTDLPFDICMLPDFVILKKYHLQPNLKNLLATIDYTVNTVVFDYRRRALHERNCIADIYRRYINFNTRLFYNKKSTAFRSLVLRFKTDFRLSESVFYFLKNDINIEILEFLTNIFRARFDREKSKALMDDYDRITGYRDYSDYVQRAPECLDPVV